MEEASPKNTEDTNTSMQGEQYPVVYLLRVRRLSGFFGWLKESSLSGLWRHSHWSVYTYVRTLIFNLKETMPTQHWIVVFPECLACEEHSELLFFFCVSESWIDVHHSRTGAREDRKEEGALVHSRSQQEMEQLLASAASDDEASESELAASDLKWVSSGIWWLDRIRGDTTHTCMV